MMLGSNLIPHVLLGLLFLPWGQSLQCHQCSSYTHSHCADPFFHKDGKPKSLEFLMDCPEDKDYTLCRKIYQNVDGDVRYIRSCGYEEHKKECYKTVLEEYNTLVCTCKGDGCNTGASLTPIPRLILLSMATGLLAKAML